MRKFLFIFILISIPAYSAQITALKNIRSGHNYCQKPGSSILEFRVIDDLDNFIFGLDKNNFNIMLNGQYINKSDYQIIFYNNKYIANINRLPIVNRPGNYSCTLELKIDKNIIDKRILKNTIRYNSPSIDVLFIIDNSASMMHNDRNNFRKTAIDYVVRMSKDNNSIGRMGIIGFSSSPSIICPLTSIIHIDKILKSLNKITAMGDTDIGAALNLAHYILNKSKASEKVAILLTDGRNSGYYKNEHQKFKKSNIKIYTVGLSHSSDGRLLKKIAFDTGAEYFFTFKAIQLRPIFERIIYKILNFNRNSYFEEYISKGTKKKIEIPILQNRDEMVISCFFDNPGTKAELVRKGRKTPIKIIRGSDYKNYFIKNPEGKKWNIYFHNPEINANFVCDIYYFNRKRAYVFPIKSSYYENEPVHLAVFNDHIIKKEFINTKISSGNEQFDIRLFDDGKHLDGNANDGVYANFFLFGKTGVNYSFIYKNKKQPFCITEPDNKYINISKPIIINYAFKDTVNAKGFTISIKSNCKFFLFPSDIYSLSGEQIKQNLLTFNQDIITAKADTKKFITLYFNDLNILPFGDYNSFSLLISDKFSYKIPIEIFLMNDREYNDDVVYR